MIEFIKSLILKYKLFVKYIIAGTTAAFVDLFALYVIADVMHVWYLPASVYAFVVAFFFGFALQKFWTFRCNDMSSEVYSQLFFYFLTGLINLGINSAGMYYIVDFIGLHHLIAQIIMGILVAAISFSISYLVTFKKSRLKHATRIQ